MTKRVLVATVADGKLVKVREPHISCWDQGLLYGYGVFETMRVYDGKIFALKAHLERLITSCVQLGIVAGLSPDDLEGAAREYVVENELESGALRLTVTRGDPSRRIHPAMVILFREITYSPRDYAEGFSALISHIRRNEASPLVYHKTLNYMENLLSLQAAREAGAQEALFLNRKGLLTEGTLSNLFFARGGVIHTPTTACGLLAGITRRTVIDLAAASGYQVVEGEYALEDLLVADEAFLTNSLMEVMPLVKVGGNPINRGTPGQITGELLQHYRGLLTTPT